eukprot:293939_1
MALDPFVGDNAEHLDWCKQRGLTLKQYISDFYNIQYLPSPFECIITNPEYKPSSLKKTFKKVKLIDCPSALLIPSHVIGKSYFWNIFSENDDILIFEPNQIYKFNKLNADGKRYECGKPPFVGIWLLYNFSLRIKFVIKKHTIIVTESNKRYNVKIVKGSTSI